MYQRVSRVHVDIPELSCRIFLTQVYESLTQPAHNLRVRRLVTLDPPRGFVYLESLKLTCRFNEAIAQNFAQSHRTENLVNV